MKTVYLLWFVRQREEQDENDLLIGVYESETDAQSAVQRLSSKPGFVADPEGFQIHPRQVGRDSWTEGVILE